MNIGVFYTKNYNKILQNMHIPDDAKTIVEPFVGNGDLLKFVEIPKTFECYDIDPKIPNAIKQDTFINVPDYNGKFVLTNPPYLAKNKSTSKEIYKKYKQDDLYKCFIEQLISAKCIGGIIVIPLNFWCSIRKSDILLRKRFLQKYHILQLNIFEEKVFEDTSYTICSFQFERHNGKQEIKTTIYPSNINFDLKLTDYVIGGEIYKLKQSNDIKISRLTSDNEDNPNITNIKINCIDSSKKICAEFSDELYVDATEKKSARSFATLIIEPYIDEGTQKMLIDDFNNYMTKMREKYHSLFLTNYRENGRKRLSFDLAFKIMNHLLSKILD